MVGNSDQSQIELQRTINSLIERQKVLEDNVERLESLEFHNRASGLGCISFEDYDIDFIGKAAFQVEFLNSPLPSGKESHSHATIYWSLISHEETEMVNLYMRTGVVAPIAAANYNYAYKYSKGGGLTQVGLDNQTEFFIGRIPGADNPYAAMGQISIPFHSSQSFDNAILGSWTAYQRGSSINSRMEKGEVGGKYIDTGGVRTRIFQIFPAAGDLEGGVYLYGWCPPANLGL